MVAGSVAGSCCFFMPQSRLYLQMTKRNYNLNNKPDLGTNPKCLAIYYTSNIVSRNALG